MTYLVTGEPGNGRPAWRTTPGGPTACCAWQNDTRFHRFGENTGGARCYEGRKDGSESQREYRPGPQGPNPTCGARVSDCGKTGRTALRSPDLGASDDSAQDHPKKSRPRMRDHLLIKSSCDLRGRLTGAFYHPI